MERKPLRDYFDKIIQNCVKYAEVGCRDCDGYDYKTNHICFEEDGYCIEGSFSLAADIIEDGDGYWTPRETIVTGASVTVDSLEVLWFDPDTDEEVEVSEDEINSLWDYIEKKVPYMVEG